MRFNEKLNDMDAAERSVVVDELISLISFNILNELSSDLTKPLRVTIANYSRDIFEHNKWFDDMLNKDSIFLETMLDYYSVLSCKALIEMYGSENMQEIVLPVINGILKLIRNKGVYKQEVDDE